MSASLVYLLLRQVLQMLTQLPATAASVLVHQSLGAQLLVVGSRGHGGFKGLVLGSVSDAAVRYAPCRSP